jgi:hypothetical protein
MAVAFTSSALDIEKWQTSMTKVAPIAALAGFTIEETTAIMAKLSDTGIEASIAGTSLRNIFLKMQDPTSELSRRVGHTITNLDDMLEVFKDMQDEGVNLANILTFMDVRQVAAFGTMLEGADDIRAMRDELMEAEGAGQDMADTVGDTLQGSILKVKSAFQGLSIAIVDNFGGALKETLTNLAKWLNELAKNPKKLKEIGNTLKWLIKIIASYVIGAKLATLWTKTMATGFLGATTASGAFARSLVVVRAGLRSLKTAIATTGIGLLVVLLGELAAAWMFSNEQVYEAVRLQDEVDDKMIETNTEIESLRDTLDKLIDARRTMNSLLNEEGKLIDDGKVSALQYKDAKSKEETAIKNINKVRKLYGQTLIDENDAIGDIKKSTEELIKVMQDKALAEIYIDMERAAIKQVVTAQTIRKKLHPFIESIMKASGAENPENENKTMREVLALYSNVAQSMEIDMRMMKGIHEYRSLLGSVFGVGTQEDLLSHMSEGAKKERHVGIIALSKLLKQHDMTFAEFVTILDPGAVANVDYMDTLTDPFQAGEGRSWATHFVDGLPEQHGGKTSSKIYIELQRDAIRKIIEAQSGTSIEELLSSDYSTPSGDGPPDNEDALYSLQHFLTKAKDIVNTALLDEDISMNLYDRIIGEEDATEKHLEAELQAIDKFIAQYSETDAEHNQDVINAKARRNAVLLKIEEEGFRKKLKQIDDNYQTEKTKLEEQRAQNLIDEFTYQALLNGITAEMLKKKIELYTAANKEVNDLTNQEKINAAEAYQMLINERDAALSKFSEIGGMLEEIAGEEEKLQGLRKAGIAITRAAAVAESIFTLQKELGNLADRQKAMLAIQTQIAEAGGIGTTIAAGFANLFKAGTYAAAGVTRQSGLIFPFNLIAMAGTIAAIIGVIASVKNLFGGDYGASAAGASSPASGGGSSSGGGSGGMMSLMTFGGRHTTVGNISSYAAGGMVHGKSHAQGGEKFAVGGRVVELEGGEAVINKRSTSMFRSQLSAMNYAGGGVKFADGGVTNIPSFAQTQFQVDGQKQLTGAAAQRSKVVVVEADITKSQNTVSAIESEAAF